MNEDETYSDKLPRKVSGKKCQSLSPEGELCGKPAAFEVGVQGDPGLHEDVWVAVFLCEKHALLAERQGWE
jgi:hypothetical protein